MSFRTLSVRILSVLVPVLAILFAYQASTRWSRFSYTLKDDWSKKICYSSSWFLYAQAL